MGVGGGGGGGGVCVCVGGGGHLVVVLLPWERVRTGVVRYVLYYGSLFSCRLYYIATSTLLFKLHTWTNSTNMG